LSAIAAVSSLAYSQRPVSPFGYEPNDGILCVKETVIPGIPITTVRKFHTFIMNAAIIANDIERVVAALNS